jgi:hypothetical protein
MTRARLAMRHAQPSAARAIIEDAAAYPRTSPNVPPKLLRQAGLLIHPGSDPGPFLLLEPDQSERPQPATSFLLTSRSRNLEASIGYRSHSLHHH